MQPDKISPREQRELEDLFIQMLVDTCSSFNVVENEEFQAFFKRLRPAFRVPSRKDVSDQMRSVMLRVSFCQSASFS